MGTSLINAAKIVLFVSLYNIHSVSDPSPVHNSMTLVLTSRYSIFAESSKVPTDLHRFNNVIFSCVWYNVQLQSSTFLSTTRKATFSLAAHFSLSKTTPNFSNGYFGSRESLTKLKLCVSHLPFHCQPKIVCTFLVLLSGFCHQRLPIRVIHQHFGLLTLSVLHVPSV